MQRAIFIFFLCLAAFALPVKQVIAQNVNGTAGNFPFPQNRDNPYGYHSSLNNNADVLAAYNKWYSDCVVTDSSTGYQRVTRPNDSGLNLNSTVSEGIGYGLVIAVYMNDEKLFDSIWNYEQKHLDGNHLMNWYIDQSGANDGTGAATDADEDMAWALLMANRQWGGSGTLSNTYLNFAVSQINNIYATELNGGVPDGGDGFTPINPSYFDPGYYREFASATNNSGWLAVAASCYTVLNDNLSQGYGNANNGLDSAWCTNAGVSTATNNSPWDYQYDACRTPFRTVKDFLWFGTASAQTYLTKTSNFFSGIGAVSIVDGYQLNGTPHPQLPTLKVSQNPGFQSAAFVGPAGCGAMISNTYQGYIDDTYKNLVGSKLLVGGTYYDESWTVMSLLMLSDNFLDYNLYVSPTPTPTLSAYAPATIRVDTGSVTQLVDSAGATWAADKQFTAGSWGYDSASAGSTSVYSGQAVSGTVNNQLGLYQTERWGNPTYHFTVPNGYYQVLFKFCENYDGDSHVGGRVFSVVEAGDPVITNLDVYKSVGEHAAYDVPTTCVVSTGQLDIVFSSSADTSQVNAIQIIRLQTPPTPTITPTKVATATNTPTTPPSPTPGGPTATNTFSPTITQTPTASFTKTMTGTSTFSPTPGSPTATPTITNTFTVTATATATSTGTATFSVTPTATPTPLYVNCAGPLTVDGGGISWLADQAYTAGSWGYTSGTSYSSGGPIANTVDPTLYETERAAGGVTYKFTLPNGVYDVVLKYAETYYTTIGARVFNVALNGVTVLSNFDIYKDSGGKNIADDKTFAVTVTNGTLELDETASVQIATIQAIGITYLVLPTSTPTATSSFTPTITLSATRTPSSTPSTTFTPVLTNTPTATSSYTATATPTVTSTYTSSHTFTSTPSNTATSTSTPGFTTTLTPTFSSTYTGTATLSPTGTPTLTFTPPFTATPTMTRTFTPTVSLSFTVSFTPTLTGTPTLSPTKTLTPVLSFTFTSTTTPTLSPTPTPTYTSTATSTATGTGTLTPTRTFTPVFSFTFSATTTSTATRTSTASATPTFTPSVTNSITTTASLTATRTFTSVFSATYTPTLSATSTQVYSPTYTGTATFSPTRTFTTVFTSSPTSTITVTPTWTWTQSPTPTLYNTFSPTYSPMPITGGKPVVFPNPSNGTKPVLIHFPSGALTNGKIQLFTTAFRKVLDIPYYLQTGETNFSFEVKDQSGNLLASGLYYLVLTNSQGKQILKLLVLR